MTPFDQAAEQNFRASTPEEILVYAKEQGIKADEKSDTNELKLQLLRMLGRHAEYELPGSKKRAPLNRSKWLPPHNVNLERGAYEGRRHRLSLTKPDGVKKETRRRISVNGYTREMRYGVVECVPEPIWLHIRDTKVGSKTTISIMDGRHLERETTAIEYRPKYNYRYEGVDPATQDRVGTSLEWYRQQPKAWFQSAKPADLKLIANELGLVIQEIDRTTGRSVGKDLAPEEMLYRIFVHIFSDVPADPEVEEPAPTKNKKAA